jgi:hypothetical protein
MAHDDPKLRRLSTNAYLSVAEHMRVMANQARSAETKGEFGRLAALYEKLAARATRGVYLEPDAPPLAPYKGVVRMPLQETYFHYSAESVSSHAPPVPGVYALWNKDFWIYIGESSDIQDRLLHHLTRDSECINRGQPTAFGFELIDDPVERVARHAALIRDLMPIC